MEHTHDQRAALNYYFTTPEGDTFALRNMPATTAAALFARYSRAEKDIRQVFLDEFWDGNVPNVDPESAEIGLRRSADLMRKVLTAFGDDSVAQLAGAHLAFENISNLAVQYIEDSRIGIAFLEKSSRYVRFDRKNSAGKYRYYTPAALVQHSEYHETMTQLFDAYSRSLPILIEHLAKTVDPATVQVRHPETGETFDLKHLEEDTALGAKIESAKNAALRSAALDALRGYLPLSTLTNVGMFANAQAYEYLLTKMWSNPLNELQWRASEASVELSLVLPYMLERAAPSSYIADGVPMPKMPGSIGLANRCLLVGVNRSTMRIPREAVNFRNGFDAFGEIATLRDSSAFFRAQADARCTRRDRPDRSLENVDFTFVLSATVGTYRDLHRHRILTQERQLFCATRGYTAPDIIANHQVLSSDFHHSMDRCDRLYRRLFDDHGPVVAQYAVPFAARTRWYMKINLRELLHICELRTTPQGHPEYRAICQDMWTLAVQAMPEIAPLGKFINFNHYEIGRLSQEVKNIIRGSDNAVEPGV